MAVDSKGGSDTASWAGVLGATEFLQEDGSVPSQAEEESDEVAHASQSTLDSDDNVELVSGGDTSKDPSSAGKIAGDSKKPESTQKASGEKEVITVTDETGRKRKVEIDYSNRDSIKRAFAAAAGMRKFQAERDQALQARSVLEKDHTTLKSNWNTLEQAYKKGPDAVFDLLSGKPGAFQEHLKKQYERERFLERASPAEVEALKEREAAEHDRRENEKLRQENIKFKEEMKQERDATETKAMESRVNPVFDRYRFDGKLGNAEDEQMFDEMLWQSTMNRLKPYEEKGLDISPELIEREFRAVAGSIRRRIDVQGNKKASQVVAQKKQEATENVQAKVKSAYGHDSNEAKLKRAIQSGDTGDIFKNWSSFRNILGGGR